MKRILVFLCLLAPLLASAGTTFTAVTTGNWNNPAIWTGGTGSNYPGSAGAGTNDTAQINGDVVVTIPTSTTIQGVQILILGLTPNTSGISTVAFATSSHLTMDAGGYIQTGRTSGQEGKIIFGAGGSLVCPTEWDLNCCVLTSTATQANPFRITGGAYVDIGFVAGARMDINVSNVVWALTSRLTFVPGDTTGVEISELVFDHCIFAGQDLGQTFGSATATPSTCPIKITNCDFIISSSASTRKIALARLTGSTANLLFQHNTINGLPIANPNHIEINTSTTKGWLIDGCVLYGACVQSDAPGGITVSNCLIGADAVAPCTFDGTNASVMTQCHLPSIADNSGGLNETGTPGTGTVECSYNLMDAVVNGTFTNRPDFFVPVSPMPTNYHNNLVIGAGEQCIGISTSENWGTLNEKNNTTCMTVPNTVDGSSFFFFQEVGGPSTGTINLANNLRQGNSAIGEAPPISGTPVGQGLGTQHLAYSDYNRFWLEGTTAYEQTAVLAVDSGNTSKVVPGSHDANANPNFVDTTRNLGTWNQRLGTGTNSYTDAINYLLTINGLEGGPGTYDQNGPKCLYSPRNVRDWVAAGFAPTNLSMRGAGDPSDGSPDIGAMPVVTKCPIGFF